MTEALFTYPLSTDLMTQDEAQMLINSGKISSTIEIAWNDLKNMRDNGQLVPGQQYRITDYKTTTSFKATRSDEHQFDIIVTADSISSLSEMAKAARHAGDMHFDKDTAFGAWKVWYCLDNDMRRFSWAADKKYITYVTPNNSLYVYFRHPELDYIDGSENVYGWARNAAGRLYTKTETPIPGPTGDKAWQKNASTQQLENPLSIDYGYYGEEGTGVIYRLVDEHNNDAPYDFKNIQFSLTGGPRSYKYTFGGTSDVTNAYGNACIAKNNKICPCYVIDDYDDFVATQCLNFIFALNMQYTLYDNIFENGCHHIIMTHGSDYPMYGCHFEQQCNNIKLGNGTNVHFGAGCNNINLGNDLENVSFGEGCNNINIFNGDGTALLDHLENIVFEPGINWFNINCSLATSHNIKFDNVVVKTGVCGTINPDTQEHVPLTKTTADGLVTYYRYQMTEEAC